MIYESNYLMHHGIKGQKWGVENGPPYPLSKSDYSAAEKKMAYLKSTHDKAMINDKDYHQQGRVVDILVKTRYENHYKEVHDQVNKIFDKYKDKNVDSKMLDQWVKDLNAMDKDMDKIKLSPEMKVAARKYAHAVNLTVVAGGPIAMYLAGMGAQAAFDTRKRNGYVD